MQPLNMEQTKADISVARLTSYHNFFSPASDDEAYGLYCWNESISAPLLRLISITEIVMRNRFHESLSRHIHNPGSIGRPDANDWYNHINLQPKSANKIREVTHFYRKGSLRPRRPVPTPNDVISNMSYGFWPALLVSSGLQVDWGSVLPSVVPNHRLKTGSAWRSASNIGCLWARLDQVGKLRNRIAHFEPVWKQGPIYEERRKTQNTLPLRVVIPAPATADDALSMLAEKHDRVCELLGWLSADRARDYSNSYVCDHFSWLCSREGLDAYRGMQPGIDLPMSRFKRELSSISKGNDMIRVTRSGQVRAKYYPVP